MTSWVCLDSNIALKLVLPETDSQKAQHLWQSLLVGGSQLAAPPLFPVEVTAVLRKTVYRGLITQADGLQGLRYLLSLHINLISFADIHEKAWQLATQFNQPTAYDAHYLALAQHLGCDFWTGDERLYNAVHPQLNWVHWLGNFSP